MSSTSSTVKKKKKLELDTWDLSLWSVTGEGVSREVMPQGMEHRQKGRRRGDRGAWREEHEAMAQAKRDKGVGEVAQTMYTHVSKCKNDKINGEKGGRAGSDKGLLLPLVCFGPCSVTSCHGTYFLNSKDRAGLDALQGPLRLRERKPQKIRNYADEAVNCYNPFGS
jgi:hypothetical protein